MVFVTGDTHGDLTHLKDARLKKGDTLIVCGDFGFVWYGDKRDQRALRALSRKKYTILFIDGVHENYRLLAEYPVVERYGAPVQELAPNVFHLLRGELYTIEGNRWFAFGGGEDTQEAGLRAEAQTYDDRCMPSEEEMNKGLSTLAAHDYQVDYIVTHCPSVKASGYCRLRGQREPAIGGLNIYFNRLEESVSYRRWFFGSIHVDKAVSGKHIAVYRQIVPVLAHGR